MAPSSFCYSTTHLVTTVICYIVIFACCNLFRLTESVDFKIDRFDAGDTSITYSGDAAVSAGVVQLINTKTTYPYGRVGQAIYADPVQIWDRHSHKLTDFTTHFTFIIDAYAENSYSHGLGFFLAPVSFQIPPNSGGGFLGLFNSTYTDSSQNQMIVVEFDTFWNMQFDPPKVGTHVGINRNSISSANCTYWNASLHSGDSGDAWVSYNSTAQMLDLRWSYGAGNDSNTDTGLSYQVDLREVLPEQAIVGFSAATAGSNGVRTIIQRWEFNSTLQINENSSEDNPKEFWKLAVGLTVPFSVLVVAAACVILWRRQLKPTKELEKVTLTSINEDLERGAGPKRFSYSDLATATNNFSKDRKLGEGGFGCVYKGYLPREGIVVAVKKISQGSRQGKKEYITEVKIISSLRHRNLVRLIGWCHDQSQFLLVYEFLPNGSLDSHLFAHRSHIEWAVRYKIATGLASALLYLHEEWEQCVVHRDIKTSNIILDSGFNAKLGDFGLARLMDHEMGLETTGLAGTLGYLAPECLTTGKASKESDVYSFGVVALEIACGRKATDRVDPNSGLGLVKWVWDLLEKDELLTGVDQKLNNEFDAKEVECLMMVGLWCVHPDRSLRPSIRQAFQVLKFEAAVPNLPIKMLVPVHSGDPEVSSGAASVTYASIDMIR
uniref:L-type lectin-domain containing receptor kinase IX.1-like n=1 Tax=Erigeron canadensis TaxID=72917 RepID=UPI001CB9030C|nr:L-type lectin-domain containing receptor kinase IX.1-like [Erigeron canadensis]